jgi:hypothetical protein
VSLDIQKLQAVRVIVTHQNSATNPCADGVASALLLHDALPEARVVFVGHGTPEYLELPVEPGMLFADITPSAERVREFVSAGAIVLDHHAKQRELVAAFGELGVYSDEPGVSGAVLAYREVWGRFRSTPSKVARAEDFATLAGIRDTWQRHSPRWREACAQAGALRFYPWERLVGIAEPFGTGAEQLRVMLAIGEVLLEQSEARTAREAADAYRHVTARGTRVAIIPTVETSDVAEAMSDVDVLVGFRYFVHRSRPGNALELVRLVLSFRSRSSYDVGAIATSLGGGGHVRAAGATVPAEGNPYEQIFKVLEVFECRG